MLRLALSLALLALFSAACAQQAGRVGNDPDNKRPGAPYTWKARQAPSGPDAWAVATCYDARRKVCVFFGGYRPVPEERGDIAVADLHEYDGRAWRKIAPTAVWPPARVSGNLAFDSKRGVCVLFGGHVSDRGKLVGLQDTWEWDGQNWRNATQERDPKPPASIGGGMAFDAKRGVCVLSTHTLLDGENQSETWLWNGQNWRQAYDIDSRAPVSDGPFRSLAYNAGKEMVCALDYGSLWFWNGQTWNKSEIKLDTHDSRSSVSMLLEDAAGWPLVLASRRDEDDNASTLLFELDDSGMERSRRVLEVPCEYSSACWDSERKQLVMTERERLENTWVAHATLAKRVAGYDFPALGTFFSDMCFDERRGVSVLIKPGGRGGRFSIWEWDGQVWKNVFEGAREETALIELKDYAFAAYDRKRQTCVFAFADNYASRRGVVILEWDGRRLLHPLYDYQSKPGSARGIVFDESLGEVLLFGAPLDDKDNDYGTPLGTVWAWNGARWRVIRDGAHTDRYETVSFVYDRARKCTLALACNGDPRFDQDTDVHTLVFDGARWSELPMPRELTWRTQPSMVYDSVAQRVLCFGGCAAMPTLETSVYYEQGRDSLWQWDGEWKPVPCKAAPPGRGHAPAAFDSKRGCMVMAGGVSWEHRFSDTWEYGPGD